MKNRIKDLREKRREKKRAAARRARKHRIGLPPGTLLHEAEAGEDAIRMSYELFRFTREIYTEERGEGLPELDKLNDPDAVTWLNIVGVKEGDLLSRLGNHLGVHPVLLEDIQNTVQRPKVEEYGDLLFIVFRMLQSGGRGEWPQEDRRLESEQISVLLGERFVVSFQERPGDVFDSLRTRIRSGKGRIRTEKADYLAYALLDIVVDTYFSILEGIEDELEDLDDLLDEHLLETIPGKLRKAKSDMIAVRRAVRPLREVVELIQKEEMPVFRESTRPYLRDLSDHVYRVIETVEMLKEMQSNIGGGYQAALSNDMNSVMKVLTIIATIFIPLTFVAGIYGMNFAHMPELAVPWAYPLVLGVMGLIAVVMLIFFRRKRWL